MTALSLQAVGPFFFFVFFFFCHTPGMGKFPGQGLTPSWRCSVYHSCGNTRSLSHCAGSGSQLAPPQRQAVFLPFPEEGAQRARPLEEGSG